MPSLKEIKGRIGSVKSTLKITSAMKLVASAKLRKAQVAVENMRPYRERLDGILADLKAEIAARQEREEPVGEISTLYTTPRPEIRAVAIVAMASNSSLCGGFNANAVRLTLETVEKYRSMGVTDITVYSIGRKMADTMKKCGYPSPEDFTRLAEHPEYEGISALGAALMEAYAEGRFDRIEIVHNHFVSTASQKPICEAFLPQNAASSLRADGFGKTNLVSATASPDRGPVRTARLPHPSATPASGSSASGSGFIVEPSPEEAWNQLLPQVIRLSLYTALLDSVAAEHAARTIAMQTATDNGEDLLDDLTLEYNKGRQQKITSEILDLVGGSLQ